MVRKKVKLPNCVDELKKFTDIKYFIRYIINFKDPIGPFQIIFFDFKHVN